MYYNRAFAGFYLWTRSIAWIVRTLAERQVVGSNPPGPATIMSFKSSNSKRRLMMKISKNEIQKVSEEPIGLFYQGIRDPATKEK